jgi:hypothetical protein
MPRRNLKFDWRESIRSTVARSSNYTFEIPAFRAISIIDTPNGGRSNGAVRSSTKNVQYSRRLIAGELNSDSLARLIPHMLISRRASQIGGKSR